ncbi:MAG TPA: diguanylate cyclase [Acidimicrobiales bacterium]|nr:diguanylate cyclase [Acidimicrobiales bacterium]
MAASTGRPVWSSFVLRAALCAGACGGAVAAARLVSPDHPLIEWLALVALTTAFLWQSTASEHSLRAEHAALVLAEERFRMAFEAAPIGVALVSPEGRFLRVNDALCRIVGHPADHLLQLTFQEITHPNDLETDLDLVGQVLRGEVDRYSMEKRYLHANGRLVTVQLDVSLVRDDAGRPLHFISQIQDITERKATLEALLSSQATQGASLDALEQGVALCTLTGEVKLLNRAGQHLMGYTAEELTERFRAGLWESYQEDGTPLPMDQRPIWHTLRTGEPTSDQLVGWRNRSGELVMLRLATEPVHDDTGTLVGVVAAFADITQQRAAERAEQDAMAQLHWQAFHDTLTLLPNRAMLLDRLERRLVTTGGRPTALLFIDLDHFKVVNDTLGHKAGDELLIGVAQRISSVVREGDTVARFGGDEFVVLSEGVTSLDASRLLADRIAGALTVPIALSSGPVRATASIGIAYDAALSADDLLRDADLALYRAKEAGRSRYEVYTRPGTDAGASTPVVGPAPRGGTARVMGSAPTRT